MRIVLLGTPQSAVPSLEAILAAGHLVPLVITQPDRPKGRSAELRPPPVKIAALGHRLDVAQPLRVRDDAFVSSLAACRPDLLVVVAYGRLLPGAVLGCAPRGAMNLHFSLLPRYRGAAPIQWALARGEEVTGVTTMAMNEKLDEGDILLQHEVPIGPAENATELGERLAGLGAALLVETLGRLETGTLEPRPQDSSQASYAPALTPADGEADLSLSARELEGRVRGFYPWPGVWAHKAGGRLRIARARALARETTTARPGEVIGFADEAFRLACGGGTVLEILDVQTEGRRVMSARDALNGRQLLPGDRLDDKAAKP